MTQQEFKAMYSSVLSLAGATQKQLAEINGMAPASLRQKLWRGTIQFTEFATLMESIGFQVKIEKISKNGNNGDKN